MTKSKVFFLILLAFIIGIAVRSFAAIPSYIILAGVWGSAVSIAVGVARVGKKPIVYGLLVLAFVAGIFRFAHVESRKPDLLALYGQELALTGIVWESPERTTKVQRLTVRVRSLHGEEIRPFFTLVTTGRFPAYQLGDELEIKGTLDQPENYGEFDYEAYLAKKSIFSTMFFPDVEKIGEGKGSIVKLALADLKRRFEENIDRVLPEPHAAFLKGLTLGERESLPDELVENFNRTGVTHIIALSGYNITLVGEFFIGILLMLTIPFYLAFWIATAMIIFFVVLTGASPSIVRAGIMGILVLVARREGRVYSIRNALAFAGAAMIFHNPLVLRFDAAFQLSFLATLGLIYLSPHVERRVDTTVSRVSNLMRRRRINAKAGDERYILFPLKRTLVETLSAQLMVLPLLIYLFGRVSIASPLTNLLVILAVPWSMAVGFLTGFLGFLWTPLSQVSGWLNWILLEYKILVIEFFARMPFASVALDEWVLIPVLILYVFVWWRIWKKA